MSTLQERLDKLAKVLQPELEKALREIDEETSK